MTLASYENILKKIQPAAREVMLYNYGEPFLNPALLTMIRLTAAVGIRTSVHSNMTFAPLTVATAEEIVTSGLNELAVAIDGATQESYGSYRIGGSFVRAVENLSLLVAARDRLRVPDLRIVWRFLINTHNESETGAAARMARSLGVPIEFALMECWGDNSWQSSYHRSQWKLGWLSLVQQLRTDGCRSLVGQARRLLKRLSARSSVASHGGMLSNLLPWYCGQVFDTMTVNWDGNVFPCCTVIAEECGVGNLLTMELDDVWNGCRMNRCRAYLSDYDRGTVYGSVCELGMCGVPRSYAGEAE